MNQKLVTTILLAISFVAGVIGLHRSITESDVAGNYWIFMISFVFYLLYRYNKKRGSA